MLVQLLYIFFLSLTHDFNILNYFKQGGYARVICTVYAIDTQHGWYYIACALCNHKVNKMRISFNDLNDTDWWCECCNTVVTKVSPRLLFHFFLTLILLFVFQV